MISLLSSAKFEQDPELRARIVLGINVVAHEIINEDATKENHVARANHANAMLQRPGEMLVPFVSSVIASPAVQQTSVESPDQIVDEAILEGIRQVWNSLIGLVE